MGRWLFETAPWIKFIQIQFSGRTTEQAFYILKRAEDKYNFSFWVHVINRKSNSVFAFLGLNFLSSTEQEGRLSLLLTMPMLQVFQVTATVTIFVVVILCRHTRIS
eukprot:TRINITY_DN488_c0_g1_i7.p1 TRINITY_DN488_c0_g1~~TRINITY_DN488_c0_g1_i7.p1  ORF type:complete len:106 (-),score=5.91 TRINITY_DN488_c0_g1_i7:799-1116(-)